MLYNTIDYDLYMNAIKADYALQVTTARLLGVSIEEYLDFLCDMEIDTIDYSLEEIESMFMDYCREYEIPCNQLESYEAYACVDIMGWK